MRQAVPLSFSSDGSELLVASNALYGRMFAEAVEATVGGEPRRVPRMEDFALLLQMSDDVTGLRKLAGTPGFDRGAYNRKLVSIGLRDLVIPG